MFKSVDKKFLVDVHVAETITTDTILGRDFLQINNCTVEMGTTNKLSFARDGPTVEFGHGDSQGCAVIERISLDQTMRLPPYSELELMVKMFVESSAPFTW